jgi:hypothetical protein
MNTFNVNKGLLLEAILKLGEDNQTTIAIEELSELQKELCKYKRNKFNDEHMAEEIAHSILMIQQIMILFKNEQLVLKYYNEAINRLTSLL